MEASSVSSSVTPFNTPESMEKPLQIRRIEVAPSPADFESLIESANVPAVSKTLCLICLLENVHSLSFSLFGWKRSLGDALTIGKLSPSGILLRTVLTICRFFFDLFWSASSKLDGRLILKVCSLFIYLSVIFLEIVICRVFFEFRYFK